MALSTRIARSGSARLSLPCSSRDGCASAAISFRAAAFRSTCYGRRENFPAAAGCGSKACLPIAAADDAMGARLIITNGDCAIDGLRAAGVAGEILPWRDMLHEGPVPRGLAPEALSAIRARYLADEFAPAGAAVRDGFAARDAAIRDHARHDRIELWFEHDLFDQLQLVQVLDLLAGFDRSEGVFLMQADDYLGPMDIDRLRALDGAAQPVTPEQFAAARQAWAAFTQDTPEDLVA